MISKAENEIKDLWNNQLNQSSYGWNVFIETNSSDLPQSGLILNTFYNTSREYDYENPNNFELYKQFTQLVWKSSKELGCAYRHLYQSSNQKLKRQSLLQVLCLYNPPGNRNNSEDYIQNVLRAKQND